MSNDGFDWRNDPHDFPRMPSIEDLLRGHEETCEHLADVGLEGRCRPCWRAEQTDGGE